MEETKFIFTGLLLKENSSISALCLEVDVGTEGKTLAEAKKNLIEAVTLYIESAVENNLPILRPVPEEDNPVLKSPKKVLEKFQLKINFSVLAHA